MRSGAAGRIPSHRPLTSPTQRSPSWVPAFEKPDAASPASCSAWEPTWAEIIVISGIRHDIFDHSHDPVGFLKGRPDGHATLTMIISLVLGGHELRAHEGDDGQ